LKKNTLIYSLIGVLISLGGCGYNTNSSPRLWLKSYGIDSSPAIDNITLCQNFGCTKTKQISLSPEELAQINQHFSPTPLSAEEERERIKTGIGLLERVTGPKLGTAHDLAENDFHMSTNQLDCVAETSNTSQYLLLLSSMKLIKFHRIGGNLHRGLFTLDAPHNSAAMVDIQSNKAFAVDSWFGKNGDPAWIVQAEHWLSGQSPN